MSARGRAQVPSEPVQATTGSSPDSDGPQPARRFAFRFTEPYVRAARPFGITPDRAWVEVGGEELVAQYGRWSVRTPLTNIAAVKLTGPYRFVKTAGPPRLGITDLGLTFASNGERGVEIAFRRRVHGVMPQGPLTHGELTVTVDDPEALAQLLAQRAVGRTAA